MLERAQASEFHAVFKAANSYLAVNRHDGVRRIADQTQSCPDDARGRARHRPQIYPTRDSEFRKRSGINSRASENCEVTPMAAARSNFQDDLAMLGQDKVAVKLRPRSSGNQT